MFIKIIDIVIIGVGLVGLMSVYLVQCCGLNVLIIDKLVELF